MKAIEKHKAQKLIEKIESDNFDENDVDSLFLKLRAYSKGFPVFREIADFVAHNDLRDRGISNQALETMYLRMKYFHEYNSPKISLNIMNPFPIWIKRLMILQVDKCNEVDLKEKFNVTPDRLKSRIDKAFKSNKKTREAKYIDGKLSLQTFDAIRHILSFLSGKPAFSQNDVIRELVEVARSNGLTINSDAINTLSNKITLCILLLFHSAEFDYKGHRKGYCKISVENSSISYNTRFVDTEGNEVKREESFGKLSVSGASIVEYNGKDLTLLHSLMSTEIEASEFCDDILINIEPLSKDVPKHLCLRLNLDQELVINKDFLLSVEKA